MKGEAKWEDQEFITRHIKFEMPIKFLMGKVK